MDRFVAVFAATLGLMLSIAPAAMAQFFPKTAALKLLAVYVLSTLISMSAWLGETPATTEELQALLCRFPASAWRRTRSGRRSAMSGTITLG
jgi:hypothetical protein